MVDRRRRVLLYTGISALVPGCHSLDRGAGTAETAPRSSEDEPTASASGGITPTSGSDRTETTDRGSVASIGDTVEIGGESVVVTRVVATRSVEYWATPEQVAIAYAPEGAFVFATVDSGSDRTGIPASSFGVQFGTETYEPTRSLGAADLDTVVMANDFEPPYSETTPGGTLAFQNVSAPADYDGEESLTLEYQNERVKWTLPEEIGRKITATPDVELRQFETPDRTSPGEEFTVTVELRNSSEDDGRFHAVLHSRSYETYGDVLDVRVPAESSIEHEQPVQYPPAGAIDTPADTPDSVTYVLAWRGQEYEAEIAL